MEQKKKGLGRAVLGRGLSALISTPVSTAPVANEAVAVTPRAVTVPVSTPAGGSVAATRIVPARLLNTEGNTALNFSENVEPSELGALSLSDLGIRFLSIDKVAPNPTQPRREFKEHEIKELSESIKSKGVLQPVLVRPVETNPGNFEIIAGERRWRAARAAGLTQIPALVRTLDDQETLEISIIENVQREDLNPVEEAEAYQRLATDFALSQQEIADKVAKDRASIANYLRILKLPKEVIEMLRSGEISMGHAKAILTIKDPSAQLSLGKKAAKEGLSVRELEAIVARVVVLDDGTRAPTKEMLDKAHAGHDDANGPLGEVIERMRRSLGTKVTIKHHKAGRGKIEIEYFSDQELDRIVDQICR